MLSSKGGSGACDLRRLCVCACVHQKHDLEALVRAVERICVYVCICVCFMEQVIFSVNVCTYVWVARPHAVKLAACSNCFANGSVSNYFQRVGRLFEAFCLNVMFA